MDEWKEGWKVLRRKGRDSCVMPTGQYGGVSYPVGEEVRPQEGCGPLVVFDRKEDAVRFRGSAHNIVPCWYKPSRHPELWTMAGEVRIRAIGSLPEGTILADVVECKE